MNRRLPFEVPPPRAYSSTPTAVRNRRYQERKRQARIEDTELGCNDEPRTSYHCICGWRWAGIGTFSATVGAFDLHARSCLFGEPVQVIVRRRARVSR
jgi:hypothetical protein